MSNSYIVTTYFDSGTTQSCTYETINIAKEHFSKVVDQNKHQVSLYEIDAIGGTLVLDLYHPLVDLYLQDAIDGLLTI